MTGNTRITGISRIFRAVLCFTFWNMFYWKLILHTMFVTPNYVLVFGTERFCRASLPVYRFRKKKHDSKEQIYYFIKFINAKLSVFGHLVSQGFLKNYLSQIEAQTHFVFKSPSIKCLPLFQFWNNIHNIYFDKTTDRMWFSGTGLSLLTSDHAMLFRFLESFSDVFVPRASKSERTRRKELFIGFS